MWQCCTVGVSYQPSTLIRPSREETFVSNRVRHAIRFHIISWLRPDGSMAARKVECFSNQGSYASHGHSIVAKAMGSFPQIYPCDNMELDAYTVFTNKPAAGAMRGYGMPQASFADDANIDECARAVHMDPLEYRMKYIMPKGFHDGFSGNTNYYDSFRECLEKGKQYIDYDRKVKEYANDTGDVRRGIGVAAFWYNTAVYPISLETSSNRMLLNLDGTVTMQCGETEIGQGADTAYSQMTAEAVGLKSYKDVRVVSCQDTDVTPTGLGAYASRQTYVAGFSIRQTATLLRQKILPIDNHLPRQRHEFTQQQSDKCALPNAALSCRQNEFPVLYGLIQICKHRLLFRLVSGGDIHKSDHRRSPLLNLQYVTEP